MIFHGINISKSLSSLERSCISFTATANDKHQLMFYITNELEICGRKKCKNKSPRVENDGCREKKKDKMLQLVTLNFLRANKIENYHIC